MNLASQEFESHSTRVGLVQEINDKIPNGIGVEVGVFKGEFSKQILENWDCTLYMVDVWDSLSKDEYIDASDHGNFDENEVYSAAINNIKGYEDRAIMIRAKSEVASCMFNDNSLDFVYIDANHAYDYVVQDINLWYPKVKSGGYICGHDYLLYVDYNDPNGNYRENGKDVNIYGHDGKYWGVFGVNPAVDEFCIANGYQPYVTKEQHGTWYFNKK